MIHTRHHSMLHAGGLARPRLPDEIEEYRDLHWRREGEGVQTTVQAERFIESVGFASCLTDSRRPGASLYVAVCGRRDAVMPRNVQKDPESSLTWNLKDEMVRRGKIYYGKLGPQKATFLAPRMVPFFKALSEKPSSKSALAVLRVLRREWEMGTADLRSESGVTDRKAFTLAIDELQEAMIVLPTDVIYQPKFTYLWGLAMERFPEQVSRRIGRLTALREIARCFLSTAGMTIPGELARVTGLSRPDAGLGNRALVKERFAVMLSPGTYRLAHL